MYLGIEKENQLKLLSFLTGNLTVALIFVEQIHYMYYIHLLLALSMRQGRFVKFFRKTKTPRRLEMRTLGERFQKTV